MKTLAQEQDKLDKYWLLDQGQKVGPFLKAKGLVFVGLDVIGEYVTEINVTSPTCIREIDATFNTSIADDLFAVLEAGRQ